MSRTANKKNKRRGIAINGMLLLDKPAGLSSNQALQCVKRLFDARKAGHTGSLDPIATGLLPLCFGETTKICGLFLNADKHYWVRIRLGSATDTGDRDGKIISQGAVDVSRAQLDAALDKFRGAFAQIPPMFSALKQNGQPLYKLAREGISVEREPRAVEVYDLTVTKWRDDILELDISCSRGFYVRTLADDLGTALGCGAHVSELRRIGVGEFHIDNARTMAQLEAADDDARRGFLLSTEQGLAHLPQVNLPDNIAAYLCRGQAVRAPQHDNDKTDMKGGLVRVYSDGAGFIGLGEIGADGKIAPKRVFNRS